MTQQKSDYGKGYEETTTDHLRELADTTTDKMKEVGRTAQETVGKIAGEAREYGAQAQEAAKQVRPFVERSLKEQPMATLAGAAFLGFVFGALWKK
jgi:ElaB/YqjD/DUF883 family membrane-anchored ribosome-binding protein